LLQRPAVVAPIGDLNEDSVIGRRKWKQAQILVHEKKIPRGLWPIAIVRRVFPGRDNRIRTVEIKTKDTVLTRPIVNISLLEQCDN
jgi:hypothetical protein